MAYRDYGPSRIPPTRLSAESGYSTSPGTLSLPHSMKEVGDYLSTLAGQVEKLQNERDSLQSQIVQFKECYRKLLIESGRDPDEGMRQLEDDKEDTYYDRSNSEHPESGKFNSSNVQELIEYLQRQDSSEKFVVAAGKCFTTSSSSDTAGPSGSLMSPEECSEDTSENEQLKQQVVELHARNDELSRRLDEARMKYPEADLTSSETCQSFSKTEVTALMRTQSVPEQLLTAHKKIEILEEIYDDLVAEKKEAESTLESSLKTVQSLDESLEEERFEKYGAMGKVKKLQSDLEGLREIVGKKPAQRTKSLDVHTHTARPKQDGGSLMCEAKTLQAKLESATKDSAKSKAETENAHQKRREMKEQLDRTVSEKLLLQDEIKELTRANKDADCAHQERREMKEQLDRMVSEMRLLQDEIAKTRQNADYAHQERRRMKDQLDHTLGEKLVLEEQVEGLTKVREDADHAHQEQREMKEQLDRTSGENTLLREKIDRLAKAKDDIARARQERREMKEALDRTVAEKLLLEDEVDEQKKKAKEWKMKNDETTCRLLQKEDEIEVLQKRP